VKWGISLSKTWQAWDQEYFTALAQILWVTLNERGFVVACCLHLLHVLCVVLLALVVCVMSLHIVVLFKYNSLRFPPPPRILYSVFSTPIPCFMDVICSVETVCKVEMHKAKSVAAWVQVYWPTCLLDPLYIPFARKRGKTGIKYHVLKQNSIKQGMGVLLKFHIYVCLLQYLSTRYDENNLIFKKRFLVFFYNIYCMSFNCHHICF
jgi:hypothetical protein